MTSYKKMKAKYEVLLTLTNQIEEIEKKWEVALPMVAKELHEKISEARALLWDISNAGK